MMTPCSASSRKEDSLIDREIAATRLSKLREALKRLKDLEQDHDAYMQSATDKDLAEHFLRLALEAALDTGNHVIAAKGLKKPLQLREIPLILGENNIIPKELADKLANATGLRNRLVHLYTDIDHEIIFTVLQNDLSDLAEFAKEIGKLVDAESKKE